MWGGVVLASLLTACDFPDITTLDPRQSDGFLAVVTQLLGPPEVSPGAQWTLRLREISGTHQITQARQVTPGDTVIFSLPPASYDVFLEGVAPACGNRYGLGRRAIVYEPLSTSIVRFNIECVPPLTIVTGTDGATIDDSYIYRILAGEREVALGTIGPNEQLIVDGIVPGEYSVELLNVAPDCALLNDGGRRQGITVGRPASPIVRYRMSCSRPEYRPRMLRMAGGRIPGASVVYLEATDPGSEASGLADLDRLYWDVTGCDATSLLRNGPREYRGFRATGSRLFGADTARVVFVLPGDVPSSPMGRTCMSVRVADGEGNTTDWSVDQVGNEFGTAPTASSLDVQIVDAATDPKVRFLFTASDPEGDIAGAFVTFEVQDGTFGAPDGRNEIWLPNVYGWDTPHVPDLRMVSFPFRPDQVVAVHVYLVDRWANASEYVDDVLLSSGEG
jgi:hypothetical protein